MAAPALVFHERKNHVPSFCPWQHKRPEQMREVVVRSKGVSILDAQRNPITVDRIAPERRWSVLEDGEILEQHRFSDLYLKKWNEWFRVAYNPPVKPPSKDTNEPIPNVVEYVQWEVDPGNSSQCRIIGFDPHLGRGKRPTALTDANGDNARPYDEVILEQYDKDPSKLKEGERRYAASLRGEKTGLQAVELQAQLGILLKLHGKGTISAEEFAKQAAELTGATLIANPAEKLPAPAQAVAVQEPEAEAAPASLACRHCGKVLNSMQGLKVHEIRWCKNKTG